MRLDVHALNVPVGPNQKERIEHQLTQALDRFADRIERVEVWVSDINGPRGGVDKRCRVEVVFRRQGVLVVSADGAEIISTIDELAERIKTAVQRRLDRRGHHRRNLHGAVRPVVTSANPG